jgi:hypothetical protein
MSFTDALERGEKDHTVLINLLQPYKELDAYKSQNSQKSFLTCLNMWFVNMSTLRDKNNK